MIPTRVLPALAALLLLFGAAPAAAEVTAIATQRSIVELRQENAATAPGDTNMLAFHFDLEPGWHTYWRNPGDSGMEMSLAWELPEGVTAGDIQWPAPERIEAPPLMTYGFDGMVAFLVPVSVPRSWPTGRPVPVKVSADWLVCEEICIPEHGEFSFEIATAAATRKDPGIRPLFDAARADLPVPLPGTAHVTRDAEGPVLVVSMDTTRHYAWGTPYFYAFSGTAIDHPKPQRADWMEGGLALHLPEGAKFPGDGMLDGVLDLAAPDMPAYVISAPVMEGSAAVPVNMDVPEEQRMPGGLGPILLAAFLGGLILNLMPCVFPVLALKALDLAKKGGQDPVLRIRGGLVYTLGVLSTFLALGGLLLWLKSGGTALGWGFQLQNPLMIAGLAWLLFGVGLFLVDLVPFGIGPVGVGEELTRRGGAVGTFFTGALAVVVATPCTAPFMATALGVALTLPAGQALTVFAALGFGLAFPFLLLSVVPVLGRILPRPGPWMEGFRQFLAFPMFASVAWLIWVLARQAGADGVLIALSGMVLLSFAAWCKMRKHGFVALLALVGALALLPRLHMQEAEAATLSAEAEPFSETRLMEILTRNQPALVNITAAWCLTCKLNEVRALEGPEFRALLEETGTAYLLGDWTSRDPELSGYLARNGRAGVPLYVYYPGNGGMPVLLDQILSPDYLRRILTGSEAKS
jgi:thiol:disulfide interchange protein DsbD